MDDFNVQEAFPTLITLKKNLSFNELTESIAYHKTQFEQLLLKNGALIFRNFPLSNAEQFSKVVKTLNLGDFLNYIGGDSPRDKIAEGIYTSTEAPPHIYIPLHQELSYINVYPKHIYFFCEIEPEYRGETIIGDARAIYKSIDTALLNRFEQKGLSYISHYYYKSSFMKLLNYFARSHKSWTEVFETEKKEEIEQFCQANGIQWKWLPKDWLELKQARPATIQHPITKEPVWFNQAHLYDFNPKLLGFMNFAATKLIYFQPSKRLHEVTFADGSKIPRADFYYLLDIFNKNTVSNAWRKGDLVVLDNVLAMHGRSKFKGKRRVLTAMTR